MQFPLQSIDGRQLESAYCMTISVRKCMRIWDIDRISAHSLDFAWIWGSLSPGSTSYVSPVLEKACITFKIISIYNYTYSNSQSHICMLR